MLDYARQRAGETLRSAHSAVLATNGPAGVQISEVECQAAGVTLYLLVPETSDHLFNLEHCSAVSLLAADWQVKGEAEIISAEVVSKQDPAVELELLQHMGTKWSVLVRVVPAQVELRRHGGWGTVETFDLES